MNLRAEDYLDVAHDGRKYRDLKRALRQLAEEDTFVFIVDMLRCCPAIGWLLANACLRRKDLVESVFLRSFSGLDVSRVRALLQMAIPRIGFRRVAGIVGEAIDTDPSTASGAIYHLARLVNRQSAREIVALSELEAKAASAGVLRGPIRIPVAKTNERQ